MMMAHHPPRRLDPQPRYYQQLTEGPHAGTWVLATSLHGQNLPSNLIHTLILEEYRVLRQAGQTVLLQDLETSQPAEQLIARLAKPSL